MSMKNIKNWKKFNENIKIEDLRKVEYNRKEANELLTSIIEDLESGSAEPVKYHTKSRAYLNITDADDEVRSYDNEGYIKTYTYYGAKLGDLYVYISGFDRWSPISIFTKEVNNNNFENIGDVTENGVTLLISNLKKSLVKEFHLRMEDLHSKKVKSNFIPKKL